MGTIESSAAVALFPGTRRGLLGLLYGQPDNAFYLREIAARLGAGMGQVQRELERLSTAGILRRFEQGRHVYFQANRGSPVFEELHGLVVKTVAGKDLLRQALTELADRIEVAFVFGSVARGEDRAESDLDLLVVGEVSLQEVVTAIAPLQQTLGREINPMVYPAEEIRSKLEDEHHFLTTVLADKKIFVVGTQNELEKLLT
ncbi:MAG: ArsR family transcriptional regulator [bacterium]|nr:ArsR family transcriptional regulator [bacterium]